MKIGIVREGKAPPDKRVPLTPAQCAEVQQKFPGTKILVQPSAVRSFADQAYADHGIEVREDLSGCDVLLGVKEVKIHDLIAGKMYFFFSHTIKKQSYNQKLLQAVLKKKIQLVDYEVLTNKEGFRIIGFGRFAGLVGAYSGLRAFGVRRQLFQLKPAHLCAGLDEMLANLDGLDLPNLKIALTGDGRVAQGALEVLERLSVQRLEPDGFLKLQTANYPVYCQLLPNHYAQRKDGQAFELMHFFNRPEMYENAFLPFAKTTDLLIAAAYWDPKAPVLFTAEDMRHNDFRISVISDITCDIEGSIPSTKKAASIAHPFYDYNPETGEVEVAFTSQKNVTVQAVDNLPCELPKDASIDFGRKLIDNVFPSLLVNDTERIIERASITKNGKLTPQFSYLQDFADGL